MASKRVYPEEICINPACGQPFNPHDYRQVFCTPQCRINFHNDQKRQQNENRFFSEKCLRQADQILEAIFESELYQEEQISEKTLQGFKVPLNIGTLEKNLQTERPVWWFHAYGLELIDREKRLYTIHYRTNI
ncbi:MAG TPA: hypothetical protein VNS32_12180 [Flavisolibacter sp.]|nr:hypothetical protein [Flavisolibacter sp.]